MTQREFDELARRPAIARRNPKVCFPRLFDNVATDPKPHISVSTDEQKLNKTERAFLVHLRDGFPDDWIGIQAMTLKLADDTRYTPDFFVWRNGLLSAYEVKGFFRDDAKVKIKVAARMFGWIRFVLVRREGEAWDFEYVKP